MSKIKYKDNNTWKDILFQIADGGTGVTNKVDALSTLAFLGKDIIGPGNSSKDTPSYWKTLGTGYAYFEQLNQLKDQPNQYGNLFSYVVGDIVYQDWRTGVRGFSYRRTGTGNSFTGWIKIFDEFNNVPIEEGGTGATDANTARDNLGVKPVLLWEGLVANGGSITVPNSTNYTVFGCMLQESKSGGKQISGCMLYGIRTSKTGSGNCFFAGSQDDSSTSYTYRVSFTTNGNTWTQIYGSEHQVNGSGGERCSTYRIYGIC